jgi:hypothetical protein
VPVDQNDMIIDHLAIELVGSSLGFQSGSLVSGTANSTWKPADGRSPLGHNVGKTEIRIDRVLKTVLAITAGALPR